MSNVLRKQIGPGTGSGEAQYMQQQSQIFVFSTTLANKGADAVMRGDYLSIIDYHCAQPGTKKYLEVIYAVSNYLSSILYHYEQLIVFRVANILLTLNI